jgi:hypothetical protein
VVRTRVRGKAAYDSQLGEVSNTKGWSLPSSPASPSLRSSSSSSFSDFRWRALLSLAHESAAAVWEVEGRGTYIGFLRPRPLGLGWASIMAAYSGSEARCKAVSRVNYRPALSYIP